MTETFNGEYPITYVEVSGVLKDNTREGFDKYRVTLRGEDRLITCKKVCFYSITLEGAVEAITDISQFESITIKYEAPKG